MTLDSPQTRRGGPGNDVGATLVGNLIEREDYVYCRNIVRAYRTDQGKGPTLDKLYVDRLSLPAIQGVIEAIAKGCEESKPGAGDGVKAFPSKANHLLRYLRRLFPCGMRHGHCKTNPALGTKQVGERRRNGMPLAAIEAQVISAGQRFTLHGLKHRGVTDTKGSRRRKQRAGGHQTEEMVVLYDHEVPVVPPAMPKEF